MHVNTINDVKLTVNNYTENTILASLLQELCCYFTLNLFTVNAQSLY